MAAMVLIVEDDESVGYLEQMMVQAKGYDVRWLRDATEIKAEARRQRPAVIIMDVMLPEKSGLEALRELRGEPDLRHIPILFVSVLDLASQYPAMLRGERVGFLQKPFEFDDLMNEIERLAK